MAMFITALGRVNIDTQIVFKSLFVTNSLDGTEDYLVSNKLYSLVGPTMLEFRKKLMKSKSPKKLSELLKMIIPPKGVHQKNVEGSELLDCEEEELQLEELEVFAIDDDVQNRDVDSDT